MARPIDMSPLLILAMLGGCGQSSAPPQTLRDRQLAELREIAEACRVPASYFHLLGTDQLQFQPTLDADYKAVECALEKVQNSRSRFKLGFVGNEAFEPGNSR